MKKLFTLDYKNASGVDNIKVMERNVHELEKLCVEAKDKGFNVVLYSPDVVEEPKNVYELSVMLAEDMVLKYDENNLVVRNFEECKQLA